MTTTAKPSSKVGDKIRSNDATILQASGWMNGNEQIVLALFLGQFVTWLRLPDDSCCHGNYHGPHIDAALKEYKERAKNYPYRAVD